MQSDFGLIARISWGAGGYAVCRVADCYSDGPTGSFPWRRVLRTGVPRYGRHDGIQYGEWLSHSALSTTMDSLASRSFLYARAPTTCALSDAFFGTRTPPLESFTS